MIIKLHRTIDPAAHWHVRDHSGAVNELVPPDSIPRAIIAGMIGQTTAYFHARREDGGRLIYGSKAKGQSW